MRAMILAAGLGTRLRPLTYLMPKPVAPVLNRPIVARIAELLAEHGFADLVTNLSYLPEQIREVLGDGSEFGLRITYSEEPEPLGTAGGVGKVRDFLAETESFLIISGDALTNIDLSAMRDAHEKYVDEGAIATLATKRVEDTTQFGVAITDEEGRIQGFQEKPEPAEALSDLANCGIYMFRREIFDHFPPEGHRSPAGGDDQPPGLRRLGAGRLPGAARRGRSLLLARDRRLLERHRLGRGVRAGKLRRARGQGPNRAAGRRDLVGGLRRRRLGSRRRQGEAARPDRGWL